MELNFPLVKSGPTTGYFDIILKAGSGFSIQKFSWF